MGAIERFQVAVGLPNSGIADNETQQRLFANDAPKAKVYKKLEYKALSRDPDAYVNEYYSFSGTIIQVLEEEQSDGSTFVTMRIATKSWYDDIVMVFYVRSKGESRFLEDDKVTVYGQYQGIYTYEAVMGNTVSVPLFEAEQVSLK